MICDTNWCTSCDNAISPYSDSLYCSEDCLKQDALMHHPMLGYDYAELKGFPRQREKDDILIPSLVRRKLSIPINLSTPSNQEYFGNSQKMPSLTPSLSSSVSSYCSISNENNKDHQNLAASFYFHPKPRRIDNPVPFME